jgi:hypothetical protein
MGFGVKELLLLLYGFLVSSECFGLLIRTLAFASYIEWRVFFPSDPLTMGYFDNGSLNKYKKNLKMEKKF